MIKYATALRLGTAEAVYVNTQLIQAVLRDREWADRLTPEDRRGLSPLFWSHVNPYGRFHLDMDTRLDLSIAWQPTVWTHSSAAEYWE